MVHVTEANGFSKLVITIAFIRFWTMASPELKTKSRGRPRLAQAIKRDEGKLPNLRKAEAKDGRIFKDASQVLRENSGNKKNGGACFSGLLLRLRHSKTASSLSNDPHTRSPSKNEAKAIIILM